MSTKISKGSLFAAVIMVAVSTALFASGTQQSPATSSTVAGNWGNVNWGQFKGQSINVLATSMPVSAVYKKHIAEFEKLTGIKVNLDLMNDTDRLNKQTVDFASHMAEYDVSNIGISNRDQFAQPGYLADLSTFLDNPKLTDKSWYNLSDYPTDILNGGVYKGTQVYIPFTAEYFLLWYRSDIFKELGLTPPKTIEELKATAQKLADAKKAGKITQYAWVDRELPGSGEAGWNLFATASRLNVNLIDYNTMTSYVNTPKGRSVLDFYTSMIKKYGPPGTGNWSWPEIAQAFKSGDIAMTVAGNASYTFIEDPSQSKVAGKVGFAPPPMAPGGKDPLWEWGWGINKASKHQGAAWLFVEWATSPTLMNEIAPEYGVPARKSVYSEKAFLNAMPNKQFVDAELYMLNKGVNPTPPFLTAKYAPSSDIISKEMSYIIAGIKTVGQAAADANTSLEKLGYKPAP